MTILHRLIFTIGVAALFNLSTANAACPSFTFSLFYTTADTPAQSHTVTDSAGNTWTSSMPDVPPISQVAIPVTLTPATCGTAPPPPMSLEGAAIIASATTQESLITSQGTWTFGARSNDGSGNRDYDTRLNGTVNGSAEILQITGGSVYAMAGWSTPGHWWKWNGATWVDAGTVGPVQPSGL